MLKLSIIILSFNSSKFVRPCLDSIFNRGNLDFEVILVDNGSRDNTLSLIKNNYPRVKLIENKENLGAAKARNQGIEISEGEWILILDCDIILANDFLSLIFRIMEKLSPQTGMIQPKILNTDRKTIYSAGIFLSSLRRFYDIGKGREDNGRFNKSKYIFGACSAAAFYKRQMFEDIKEETGYFDKRFFFLVEDVDLAWRAQNKRWKALYYPEAVCYHSGNSSNTSRKIRQYLCFRNRYYSIIKNESFKKIPIKFFLSFPYDSSRLLYLLFNNPYTLKAIKEIFGFAKTKEDKRWIKKQEP